MNRDDIFLVIISLILVFSVLAGISIFVYFISVMIRSASKKEKTEEIPAPVVQNPIVASTKADTLPAAQVGDDPAIIAAIIAAITAYRAHRYGPVMANRFRVVSFKRTSGR